MEENWYVVEQQVRDRISEARAGARILALTQKLATPARRPSWVRARAMEGLLRLSRRVASVRAVTKRCQSANPL
jgi:hypothetical protein